jgi:4-amino-4-deoxy-L-arabinose transferase-like glycosyltransferase
MLQIKPISDNRNLLPMGWVLTICFIAMTFIPRSLDHVQFVDGLAYASISRNMAAGLGSFWQPYFADSFWLPYNKCSFFCEHPPLMFFLQSLLFQVFGNGLFVENIYNTIVLAASIYLIARIWKILFRNNLYLQQQSWLPVLMWYSIRTVWWSIPNNLLDSTMTVFCLCSCLFQLRAIHSRGRQEFAYWILAGISIFLACLTKGPTGVFPLAFSFIYAISYRNTTYIKVVSGAALICCTLLFSFIILLQYPPARFFLTEYLDGQVISALTKKREKINDSWTAHFYILNVLLKAIIPHIALLFSLYGVEYFTRKKIRIESEIEKPATLMFLTSLSVILPMMISVKQSDYYLMPALPFVAGCFATLAVKPIATLYIHFTTFTKWTFTLVSILFVAIGTYLTIHQEDDYMYKVSNEITEYVPGRSTIYLPEKIALYSEIHTPLQRYAYLSVAFNHRETNYLYFDNSAYPLLDSIRQCDQWKIINLQSGPILAIKTVVK